MLSRYISIFFLSIVIIVLFSMIISNCYNHRYIKKREHFRKELYLTFSPPTEHFSSSNISNHDMIKIPVYYINLDRSPARKIYIENQFRKHNIQNTKRIRAIDGSKIIRSIKSFAKDPIATVDGITFFNNYTDLKLSELACTLSHLLAIRTAYEDDLDEVLIVEDDVNFGLIPYWKKSLPDYMKEFPKKWSCVSLFNMACYIEPHLPSYIHIKSKICYGGQGYIINRIGMKNILKTMSPKLLVMNSKDHQNKNKLSKYPSIADVFIYNRIRNCYQRKIPLLIPFNDHDSLNSTLHTHHTKKHNLFANEVIALYDSSKQLSDLK